MQLDLDRTLALSYVPAARRPALEALWRLDTAMGAALQGGREPLIAQIKLAWWRDSLARLDTEKAPAEPVLQDVAASVLSKSLKGEQLAQLEEGWTMLLGQEPLGPAELEAYAVGRGARLFRYSSSLLGFQMNEVVKRAGEGWALVDLARNSNPVDGRAALDEAAARLGDITARRWPAPLRPLGMLAMLARRDADRGLDTLERPGAPARMARMFKHRLTGR